VVGRTLTLLAAALACLLASGAASAADTRLTLHGRVVDENGLPVGNVQVKLEGLPKTVFAAASDDAGYFSIPNLEPGTYSVQLEKVSFFLLRGQTIQLAVDSTEFTFTLNHAQEVRETVDVVADPNRIEPGETQQSATLTAAEIFYIPIPSSHDLQQSLVALPQVLRDAQDILHVAGARSTETQYLMDGFEIGSPVDNSLTMRLIVDAVRSAEIETGRFGAEYAHPGAALLRIETPEGDDRWRFNATDFIPGINVQEGVHLGNYYPRFTFSGPIVEDKLWFLQSVSVDHTLAVQRDITTGPNTSEQWGGDSFSRLLWHASENDSLHFSFLYNDESDTNAGLDALHPQSTTLDVTGNRLFGSVKNQWWVRHTLVEVGFAEDRTDQDFTPQGTAPYVLLVNGAQGNYYQDIHQDSHRHQFFADAIHAGEKWHGTHTISGGGNFSEVELSQSAARGEIQALNAGQSLVRQTTFAGNPQFDISNHLAGGFLQDTWKLDSHWVLQAGIRGDWDQFVHAAMAEPRVSANYLPYADDRAKFSLGWGIYNIPLNLSVLGQTQDQQQVDTLYAYGSACAPPQTVCLTGPAASRFALPSGGLQQPFFYITSAGWQQRFGGNTVVGVELLARNEQHGLVYETLTPGQIGSVFLLQSSRRDKYRSATVTARHTFANGAVLFGSYTRSKANTDQDLDPVLGQLYFAAQQGGPLSWDAPNRALSWGTFPTHIWSIDFSYLFEYRTGYPFSVINQQQFLIGAPNSMRFPDYASLNISVEKKFRFGKYLFAVRGSVINLTGRQNPDVVVNNIDAVGVTPAFLTFEGGQGRAFTGRLRFLGRH
jgi:Carboxypeptidase regulatory-like domain/TonB dependent receptor